MAENEAVVQFGLVDRQTRIRSLLLLFLSRRKGGGRRRSLTKALNDNLVDTN